MRRALALLLVTITLAALAAACGGEVRGRAPGSSADNPCPSCPSPAEACATCPRPAGDASPEALDASLQCMLGLTPALRGCWSECLGTTSSTVARISEWSSREIEFRHLSMIGEDLPDYGCGSDYK